MCLAKLSKIEGATSPGVICDEEIGALSKPFSEGKKDSIESWLKGFNDVFTRNP